MITCCESSYFSDTFETLEQLENELALLPNLLKSKDTQSYIQLIQNINQSDVSKELVDRLSIGKPAFYSPGRLGSIVSCIKRPQINATINQESKFVSFLLPLLSTEFDRNKILNSIIRFNKAHKIHNCKLNRLMLLYAIGHVQSELT
jgi:hypothetical protein